MKSFNDLKVVNKKRIEQYVFAAARSYERYEDDWSFAQMRKAVAYLVSIGEYTADDMPYEYTHTEEFYSLYFAEDGIIHSYDEEDEEEDDYWSANGQWVEDAGLEWDEDGHLNFA